MDCGTVALFALSQVAVKWSLAVVEQRVYDGSAVPKSFETRRRPPSKPLPSTYPVLPRRGILHYEVALDEGGYYI
jgi:hypothetical protein